MEIYPSAGTCINSKFMARKDVVKVKQIFFARTKYSLSGRTDRPFPLQLFQASSSSC
jgi:hypothetical protein